MIDFVISFDSEGAYWDIFSVWGNFCNMTLKFYMKIFPEQKYM